MTATRSLPHHPELLELLYERELRQPSLAPVARPVAAPRRLPAAGRRTAFLVAGLVLAVVATVIAGQQVAGSADPRAWTRYGNTVEMRTDAELVSAMVGAPDGYTVAPASLELEPGPVDLAKAKAEETVPAAIAALDAGFVRGHAVAWARSETQFVAAAVYQFDSSEDAASYIAAGLTDPAIAGNNMVASTPPDIEGASAFNYTPADSPASVEAVTFARGPYAVFVVGAGVDGSEAVRLTTELAEAQHHNLAKLGWLDALLDR